MVMDIWINLSAIEFIVNKRTNGEKDRFLSGDVSRINPIINPTPAINN